MLTVPVGMLLIAMLTAGLLTAGMLLVPVSPTAAAPEADQGAPVEPLQVTIDDLAPATLPRRGPIRVSGTVTNVDAEVWRAVNLYSFVSDTPMTTAAELVEAAASDPLLPVGERIIDPGPYLTIAELAPGESATYSFEVPRRRIAAVATGVATGVAGVYWFGVHALGEGPEGRVEGADGRARTFLPLVPPRLRRTVDTALVIPIRQIGRAHV